MVAIIWIDQAIEDIDYIAEYISQASMKYAAATVNKIFQRAEILKTYPQAGRMVPETNNNSIRELIEGNYRIIYEIISEERIEILTVHHSARPLNNIL